MAKKNNEANIRDLIELAIFFLTLITLLFTGIAKIVQYFINKNKEKESSPINGYSFEIHQINTLERDLGRKMYEVVLVGVLTGQKRKRLFSSETPLGKAYLNGEIGEGDVIDIQTPAQINKEGYKGLIIK